MISIPTVCRVCAFSFVLFSHMVEMVELSCWSLRCTGHGTFNLSYSAIQWKWSNYDIGPYGVQGMLIFCLISQTVEMVELAYWSYWPLQCTGYSTCC